VVKLVALFRILWDRQVRSESRDIVREAQRLEKDVIFEFRWFPSGGGGRGCGWESDEVLCRLCECLLGWASMGHGDAHVIWDGGPVCGGDEGFDDGVIIVYGGKKGLKSMRF